ncbi:MAG: hypothetical protein QXH13_03175, partial [Thermoplasmata archaeon]
TATIPAASVTMEGVDYYIVAVDENGNTAKTEEYYIQVLEGAAPELNSAFITIIFLAAFTLWIRRSNFT